MIPTLLQATRYALQEHGIDPIQVNWVRISSLAWATWETFAEYAASVHVDEVNEVTFHLVGYSNWYFVWEDQQWFFREMPVWEGQRIEKIGWYLKTTEDDLS
jgi:hypothetical protein